MKKTVTSSIGWMVLFIFLLVVSSVSILPFTLSLPPSQSSGIYGAFGIIVLIALGILLTVIYLTYLYQRWYFEVYFYDLTEDYIIIKKGPITPREITIPYERVQDIYVDQDLFDRLFGLFDVHLSSATISSGMEAHIDGVENAAAQGLRTMLLKTVSEKITKSRSGNISVPTPANNPQNTG